MTFCFSFFFFRCTTHKLVGDVGVVPAGHPLPDGRLHESRQGGQHVDGGVDLERRKHESNCQQRQPVASRKSHRLAGWPPYAKVFFNWFNFSQFHNQSAKGGFGNCRAALKRRPKRRPSGRRYWSRGFSKEISTDVGSMDVGRLDRTFHIIILKVQCEQLGWFMTFTLVNA